MCMDRARAVIDVAMDRGIVLGYTRVGYHVRSLGWGDEPAPGSLTGRVALVTGANSGLGKATAAGLARLGASVRLLVRDRSRGQAAAAEIAAAVPGADLALEVCDVGDLERIRDFAADFADRVPVLDLLVHNAGVYPERRTTTRQGNELAFATHVLGPFALTAALLPSLRASGDARIVWVSSGGMYAQRLSADDLQYERGDYRGGVAYARTKRMQVVLAEQWAERLAPDGISVHSVHPGWADTPGVAGSLPLFRLLTRPLLRSPEQGADTVVWLCAAEEPGHVTGAFWHDRRTRPTHYLPLTRESARDREGLWAACERLTGSSAATAAR